MNLKDAAALNMVPAQKYIIASMLAVSLCVVPCLAQDATSSGVGAAGVDAAVAPGAVASCDQPGRCQPNFPLSDDQLEKLNSLRLQMLTATEADRVQLHTLHAQLADVLSKPVIDRAAAVALQAKINSLHSDLAVKMLNFKMDRAAVMTPEQRTEMRHHYLLQGMFHHCRHQGPASGCRRAMAPGSHCGLGRNLG